MHETGNDGEWPLWIRLALWGLFICFVFMFDFRKMIPMTIGTFLGYLAVPSAMGANVFPKRSKGRWILAGVTIGLVSASVIVSLYIRHGGGTTIR
jgi:hypothetical protein